MEFFYANDSKELSFSRLISPSCVKKISLIQMKSLKAILSGMDDSEMEADSEALSPNHKKMVIFDDLETWSLSENSKSMNFFRC